VKYQDGQGILANNYIFTVEMGADYIDYTFSGAFYAPDHGYVVLLTPVPYLKSFRASPTR